MTWFVFGGLLGGKRRGPSSIYMSWLGTACVAMRIRTDCSVIVYCGFFGEMFHHPVHNLIQLDLWMFANLIRDIFLVKQPQAPLENSQIASRRFTINYSLCNRAH